MAEPCNSQFSVKHRSKMEKVSKNVPNTGISPEFWLTKEGNDTYNVLSRFQNHTNNNLFKIAVRILSGDNPPYALVFDGLP